MASIVIAGGHGKIALRLAKVLSGEGHEVRALIRNVKHADDVREAGGVPVEADLEVKEDYSEWVRGADVVVFAAGTGNPFFTTDTAAALRGAEIGAQIVLKATKVDGVYTADPAKDPKATRYRQISFDEAITRNLQVMDATAFALCRDQKLPIRVFSIFKPGALRRVVVGEDEGTLVHV